MPKDSKTTPAPSAPAVEPAAAPAAAPAPTTPPAAKPDVSDVISQDSAVQAMLGSDRPTKKEKAEKDKADKTAATPAPEPAAAPAPVVTPPAEPAAATPPTPKKVNVRKAQPPKSDLNAQTIADAVAAGVSKVLPKAAEPTAEIVDLPEHLAASKPLYDELERSNPAKYKGVAKKMAEFAKKEVQYASDWEDRERARLVSEGKAAEANDVAYSSDDPQHAHFYQRNAPKIDPGDLEEAKFEVKFNDRFNRMVKPKLDEADQTITGLRAAPAAQTAVSQFGQGLIHTLNPEAGGKLTAENYQKWAEANPIEAEVATAVQQQVQPVVHAASLLWDGALKFDQNNEAHTTAAMTFNNFEQALASQPNPVEDDKGRTWLPLSEYSKLSRNQQSEHFTTTKEALVSYIALNAAQRVRSVAGEHRQIIEKNATRLGYQKPQVAPVTPQATPAATPTPAPALVSPSVSGGGPIAPTSGVAPKPVVEGASAVGGLLGVR